MMNDEDIKEYHAIGKKPGLKKSNKYNYITGQLNSWAWRKHAKILRAKQKIAGDKLTRRQEAIAYLEELKRKL